MPLSRRQNPPQGGLGRESEAGAGAESARDGGVDLLLGRKHERGREDLGVCDSSVKGQAEWSWESVFS